MWWRPVTPMASEASLPISSHKLVRWSVMHALMRCRKCGRYCSHEGVDLEPPGGTFPQSVLFMDEPYCERLDVPKGFSKAAGVGLPLKVGATPGTCRRTLTFRAKTS